MVLGLRMHIAFTSRSMIVEDEDISALLRAGQSWSTDKIRSSIEPLDHGGEDRPDRQPSTRRKSTVSAGHRRTWTRVARESREIERILPPHVLMAS